MTLTRTLVKPRPRIRMRRGSKLPQEPRKALNERFEKNGKSEVKLAFVPNALEGGDLLEMPSATAAT